jgi:ferredoxin--NADP+ reductase
VIGTNKSDAAEVMKLLISRLAEPRNVTGVQTLLNKKGTVHISQAHWELINSAEVAKGEPYGKPRVKFTDRREMLGFAG